MVKPETSDPLPPEEIIQRIKKALHHGGDTHTWEDVCQGLVEGKFQIFWNDYGVCITEIMVSPRTKYLNAFIVAGKLPGVMDLQEQVENFAREQSCKFMLTTARHGWKKVLPNYGWKPTKTVFAKKIEGR